MDGLRFFVALSTAALLSAVAHGADFNFTKGYGCGGACNAGKLTTDLHYSHMGDENVQRCQQLCDEIGCRCFDYAGPGHSPSVRKGELCRVCPASLAHLPLQLSSWGYIAAQRQPSSWGSTFLLLFAVLVGSYFGLGWLRGAKVKGLRGVDALPHAPVWKEVAALVQDGISWSRGESGRVGRRRPPNGYGQAPGGSGRDGGGSHSKGKTSSGGSSSGGDSSKKSKSSRKEKASSKSKKSGVKESVAGADQAAAASVPMPEPVREWAPTRTGLLLAGARETGVKVDV